MLLHITDKCSLGCPHCLGDYKPDGEHMSSEVFKDAIDFIIKTNPIIHVTVTGGEPTEHPDFVEFMDILISALKKKTDNVPKMITITTNGFWCLEHPDDARKIINTGTEIIKVNFQVSTDKRYYPIPLDTNNPLWKENGFVLCEDCVTHIYPQGRALSNKIPYQSKAPRCFNFRSFMKTVEPKSGFMNKLEMATMGLLMKGYTCTPSIGIHGEIIPGESRLCPPAASIYDDMDTIEQKLTNFRCHKCEFLLPPKLIEYINS